MHFEGSEKKVEVVVDPFISSLRNLGQEFWSQVVGQAQAQILSKISSQSCDAYLLSESSLFVWDHHFTMITCGTTTLVDAILCFLEKVRPDQVQSLIYERKNEYFPHHQKSDFFEDAKRLRSRFDGKAFRFGKADTHHVFLFHLDKEYRPPANDCTLEILMYDLRGPAKSLFSCENQTIESIREKTNLHKILPDFEIDDHLFDPCGYSLNALRGSDYYTIHVTPEEVGSYVSFESNIELDKNVEPTIRKVLEVFQPRAFDVVVFRPQQTHVSLNIPGFARATSVKEQLTCGYEVSFTYHHAESGETQGAMDLEI